MGEPRRGFPPSQGEYRGCVVEQKGSRWVAKSWSSFRRDGGRDKNRGEERVSRARDVVVRTQAGI